MSLLAIALRVIFAFLFLLLILRISGKRSVGQGTPLDFVVALILGDMIDDLVWGDVSAAQFVVGAGSIVLAHLLAAVGACASPAIARALEGTPLTTVEKGSLQQRALRRERQTQGDVMGHLRQCEVEDLRQVERATLEYSGHLSVSRRSWAKEAQKRDLDRVREAAK